MKTNFGFFLTVLIVSLMFFANHFLRLDSSLLLPSLESEFVYEEIRQIIITLIYLLVPVFLFFEKNNLHEHNLDQTGLLLFIASSLITIFEVDIWYFLVIVLSTTWLVVIVIQQWMTIPKTNLRWIGIAIFLSILITFLTVFILAMLTDNYSPSNNSIPNVFRLLIISIGISAAKEEILFRLILWGYLSKMKLQPRLVFTLQFFLFWLAHSQSSSEPWFYVSLPLATITYSFLAFKSKQITPSILAHAIFNVAQPIFAIFLG